MARRYWDRQSCTEEALKYDTKTAFNKGCVGAYTHALKHGFLDEICSHMEVKWKKKWTDKEVCHKEALKYKTRTEFQDNSNGAYTYAMRHGFLDEICSHMDTIYEVKWNSKDACAKEALKYQRRVDFQRGSNSAYTYAMKHGFLDDICGHMTFYGVLSEEKEIARTNYVRKNLLITDEEWKELESTLENASKSKTHSNRIQRFRCIYACEFDDNHVYVGLANNLKQRIKQHLRTAKSPIYKYIEESKAMFKFKIIRGFEPEKVAQKNEGEVEAMYENLGWIVLNKAKTGALGGDYLYWTLERCLEVAKLATSMSDYCRRFSGAYASCRRNNWVDELRKIIPQNVKPQRKSKIWTLEELEHEAMKYNCRTDFKAHSSSAYKYAKKNDLLDKICREMKPSHNNYKYSLEDLKCEALKYQTRRDFRNNSPKFYDSAKRRKILDEICAHMATVDSIYWTKERCRERAMLYQTKMEFKHNDGSAYTTSVREGWLDEICTHMHSPEPKRKWTYEKLKETASLYKTRKEFKENDYSAYTTVVREKVIDDICTHMEKKRKSFTDEEALNIAKGYTGKTALFKGNRPVYTYLRTRGLLDKAFPSNKSDNK